VRPDADLAHVGAVRERSEKYEFAEGVERRDQAGHDAPGGVG
jgi:hypothetical protein